jgi:hypothetical protein
VDVLPDRHPLLTIIVVSFNDEPLLVRCLEALAAQAPVEGSETLVVRARRGTSETPSSPVRGMFRHVRFIEAPSECTVPRMRAIGIAESRGRVVALIEDDCVARADWAQAVVRAHLGPDAAVGGAVEPGPYARGLDWCVFFCDYGRFMLPLASGPAMALAGNNMSYKRAALAEIPAVAGDEFQEVFVHRALAQRRVPMRTDPSVVVVVGGSWRWAHVTSVPYHHGRAYAAARVEGQRMWRRVLMSLLALPLPALKVARVAREVLSRRRLIAPLIVSLPWVVLLSTSWSIGESAGYLLGPGDSPSTWR